MGVQTKKNEAETFYEALFSLSRETRRVTLDFKEVIRAFSDTFKASYFTSPDPFHDTTKMLQILEETGKIILPAGDAGWDYAMNPPVPKWIKIMKQKSSPVSKPWITRAWHPEFHWIPGEKSMTRDLYELLLVLEAYVKSMPETLPLIPEKERSLQIFGNEKTLRELIMKFKNRDFFALAKCYQTYEPLIGYRFKSSVNRIIFVENRDTFLSLTKVNAVMGEKRLFSGVFYGQGLQFLTSVLSIPLEFETQTTIEYFGDVDRMGFEIPINAAKILTHEKPSYSIIPSTIFYERLCTIHAKNALAIHDNSKQKKTDYSGWLVSLPGDVKEYIKSILERKHRIPQELLSILEIHTILTGRQDFDPRLAMNHTAFMKEVLPQHVI